MTDQEKEQSGGKLPRREFFKGVLMAGSRDEANNEDDIGQNGENADSVEETKTTEVRMAELREQQRGKRDVMQLISYGLYLLTTAHEEKVNVITCNWLTQISFEPLLVLVAIEKQSYSHQLLQESGVFAVNFLSKEQTRLARNLAAPHKIKPFKLTGIPHHPGATGVPLVDEAIAYLECEVRHTLEVDGDHTLFVGEVVAGDVITRYVEPLTLLVSGLRYK